MTTPLSLEPGSLFARDFRIERPLAEGGMGAVYIVHQISTGRRRALKVMQPELMQNDDLRRRFVLEAKVGASIDSEHVVEVQVAGIDEQTGAPFLVMELLDGVDLATHLEQHGALSLDELRELFRQMCHALSLAHRAGIVHRDLKPANVFLAAPKRVGDGRFHVKVLDFGIAKMTFDATVGGAKTGMIGTPLWMAPEQADHVPVTPAADVWALGLMLYAAATDRSFWRNGNTTDGVSVQQILREMLFDPIPSALARAGEQGVSLPAVLESVIARSVVRRPAERLADAGAFFVALDEALQGRAPVAPATPFGGALLEAPDFESPSLELALQPSRPASRAMAAAALPAMTAAPRARLDEPAFRSLPEARSPALLVEGRRGPWWLVYLVPIALVIAFGLVVRSRLRDAVPDVQCRLCTVANGTVVQGTIPPQDIRHDIEERFPELDTLCVKDASGPGRATLHWVINGGDVGKGATVVGGGSTGVCLLGAITRRQYAIIVGVAGFGHTDITYVLEWDPAHPAATPHAR